MRPAVTVRSRLLCWCAAFSLVGLAAGDPLSGQAFQEIGHTCDACHGLHAGRFRPDNDFGPGAAFGIELDSYGFPLQKEEARCTRCHASSLLGPSRLMLDGRLRPAIQNVLGSDLSDDHPLGRGGVGAGALSGFDDDPLGAGLAGGLDGTSRPASPDWDGRIGCANCHDVHADPVPERDPFEYQMACENCHQAPDFLPSYHTSLNCGDCHVAHASPGASLLSEISEGLVCARCHDGGVGETVTSNLLAISGTLLNAGHFFGGAQPCSDCHAPHGGVR